MAPEESEWLDGPRLVEFLAARGLTKYKALGTTTERRIGRWKAGGAANVYAVDAALIQFGMHLSELPDDLWIEGPTKRRYKEKRSVTGKEDVRRIIERLKRGDPPKAIARDFNLSPSGVRYYRQKIAA